MTNIQALIEATYSIYFERAAYHPELRDVPVNGAKVPDILAASTSQDIVGVTVRMLSVYDGCHGVCRGKTLFVDTMMSLLAYRQDD